jgi:hypothetical protein
MIFVCAFVAAGGRALNRDIVIRDLIRDIVV